MSLNKELDRLIEELKDEEELDEANVTGAGEAYDTPKAFGKNKPGTEENSGYKKVKESAFLKLAKQTMLSEISYKEYKKDGTKSSQYKVNKAIKEINGKLFQIERIVTQNIKLKTEDGVDSKRYWKSTRENLYKIAGKMATISERLRKF